MVKRKRLLCLLALLLLLTCSLFIVGQNNTGASPVQSANTHVPFVFFSTHPLAFPLTAASGHVPDEAVITVQPHTTLSSDNLPAHQLLSALLPMPLDSSKLDVRLATNALLLPVMAHLLGLSNLVLRE